MSAASNDADFQLLFEAAPGSFLVLKPDFTIVAASDAYLRATMTDRSAIVGRGLFEVFPDNPEDPERDRHAQPTRLAREGPGDARPRHDGRPEVRHPQADR